MDAAHAGQAGRLSRAGEASNCRTSSGKTGKPPVPRNSLRLRLLSESATVLPLCGLNIFPGQ